VHEQTGNNSCAQRLRSFTVHLLVCEAKTCSLDS
jgi:hypothetical protein